MAGGKWADAGRSTVGTGVPTKRGEMVDRCPGDSQRLGEAPNHPSWPQEQRFPLISVHGRSIFILKGVPWPSTISRCTITERAFDARSIMVHLDMVLGRGRLHESEEASRHVRVRFFLTLVKPTPWCDRPGRWGPDEYIIRPPWNTKARPVSPHGALPRRCATVAPRWATVFSRALLVEGTYDCYTPMKRAFDARSIGV